VAEAGEKIAELTGIRRKPSQVRSFLKHIGMKPRRVAAIPAKADGKAQQEFHDQVLQPKLQEAQNGQRVLFFMDAAHFVLAPFLGIVWCFARLFIKAPSGRQRFNVLGALNAVTKEVVTVCNDTYITSEQVCQLLEKLRSLNPLKPLSIVLDNARYQRCALVQECSNRLKIELLFLPSYSPNLNLIERFWKFVKKQCLYSRYYPTFTEFKTAISTCIDRAPFQHKNALDSLLTPRFQTFPSAAA
jgi:transposase